jgi:hypothetical protein
MDLHCLSRRPGQQLRASNLRTAKALRLLQSADAKKGYCWDENRYQGTMHVLSSLDT